MIELYQVSVEAVENGYVVYLYPYDQEKDESKPTEKHVFQNQDIPADSESSKKLAKNKAFQFAKEQLGSKQEEAKY